MDLVIISSRRRSSWAGAGLMMMLERQLSARGGLTCITATTTAAPLATSKSRLLDATILSAAPHAKLHRIGAAR
jgi:hypothetical protein